jgi:hypothetical protein
MYEIQSEFFGDDTARMMCSVSKVRPTRHSLHSNLSKRTRQSICHTYIETNSDVTIHCVTLNVLFPTISLSYT